MTAVSQEPLSQKDWESVQAELASCLCKASVQHEADDWHFPHWMVKHGTHFFHFVRQERAERPERLTKWWITNHNKTTADNSSGLEASLHWVSIKTAWDEFLTKPMLEAA